MAGLWLQHYPPGVPAQIDTDTVDSLPEVLDRSCRRFGSHTAYSHMGTSMSFDELDRQSRAFAAWLQATLGLRRGDRVALMMPNLLQMPVATFGVLRAGGVVVNVNPLYTATEVSQALEDSGAVAIVVLENFAHTVQAALASRPGATLAVVTTEVGDLFSSVRGWITNLAVRYVKRLVPDWTLPGATGFNAALRAGHALTLEEVPLGHADIAFLQYTGGTTGVAKGAVLTHGNMVANLLQLSAWIGRDLCDGQEVFVCPLPLYHVYALSSSLVFLAIGAHTVLVANPRDLPDLVEVLKAHRVTALIGVNTLYRSLLDAPGFAEVDWGALKLAHAGGMAVQRSVAERWKRATGRPLVESYGLTEASPGVCSNPLGIAQWNGSIGQPLPSTEVVVLDALDTEVPAGEVGELCVRGPQVMAGYWRRPEETARAFTATGFLRTGDMGFMDGQGAFTITDRKKDMIVVSGFKVFPSQVEDMVALHPGVAEVGAFGVADVRSGEAVKIVVVRRDPGLTEQDLRDHCRQHLTGYKRPRDIEFRTEPLPRTNLGKVLRRQLRDAQAARPGVATLPAPAAGLRAA
ncbi:AMP-binding protein [Ideonella sp. A 288]|uniref:AMP-binding protein n=1 Tax=Ideonella sp. A 288 TaxID=1962181 RepID=UPI000B4B24BB|nr:AMP-binding protein [Ideonella sp. A 288]